MKMGKKTVSILAVVAGVSILATSAFADVVLGSGYTSLKQAVKTTTAKVANEFDSITADMAIGVKLDGSQLYEATSRQKMDMQNERTEGNTTERWKDGQQEASYYQYNDPERYVTQNSDDGVYYLYNREPVSDDSSDVDSFVNDPFDDEQVADLERIFDAFVGNLQDLVQSEEADGKMVYMGNLSESQVPPLVNAVVSFCVKYGMMDSYTFEELGIPALRNDISVTGVSGKAIASEDGVIESVIGTGSLVGRDANGVMHTFELECSLALTDINGTTIAEFDPTGKQVEEHAAYVSGFTDRYVGTYVSEIVDEEAMKKLGDRTLTITAVDDTSITGTYTEVYKEGEAPETGARSFDFVATLEQGGHEAVFQYTEADGTEKTGIITYTGGTDVYVAMDVEYDEENGSRSRTYQSGFSEDFRRVFE